MSAFVFKAVFTFGFATGVVTTLLLLSAGA